MAKAKGPQLNPLRGALQRISTRQAWRRGRKSEVGDQRAEGRDQD